MKNCVDEGILQAWFDGELAANEAARVVAHLHACAECAANAQTVEADNLLLSEALAEEFTAAVPTERLRQRIDTAVAGLNQIRVPAARTPRWSLFTGWFGSLRPLAYASVALIILLAAIAGFIYLKQPKTTVVANTNNDKPAVVNPTPQDSPQQAQNETPKQIKEPVLPGPTYVAYHKTKTVKQNSVTEPDPTSPAWQARQYENAIAQLDDALKTQPPMRPALQVEYEYNMAVIDSAIASTREAAKKNPKDPLANQFMLAAYQSKVDFMNQIADARGMGR